MDIKRLLSKKGWTGEETGKALVLDLINSYKQNLAGNTTPKPLFPMEKITEMLHNFKGSRTDIEAYNRYVNLQNWIMQYQAVANANLQRFNSSFNEFVKIHNAAEAAENEYRYIERLPRILTQKQYDELRAKRIEETLSAPDASDTLFHLVLRLTAYLVQTDDPSLKAVKELYQKQPLTNAAYIIAYNRETDNGYSQLPDGTRSDKVTPEEWRERLLYFSPDLQRLKAEADEGYAGEPGSLSYERMTKEARAAHMGEPRPDKGRETATWHIYEEAPEGLTKWEFIVTSVSEVSAFSKFISGLTSDNESADVFEGDSKAFKNEFPELTKAVLEELAKLGFLTKNKKPLSSIPAAKWANHRFSWRSMYDSNFPGFREWIENDCVIFADDKRAIVNGIAIVRPAGILKQPLYGRYCASIDENGCFEEPDEKSLFSNMFGLEAYTPDNPESGDNIDRIERTRATLIESLRLVIGYDVALEIIAKEIGIPEFTIFKADGERRIEKIKALNSLFDLLYTHIADIDYRDEERKAAKLQALRDVFYPIDTDALIVSKGRRKEAARMLEDLEAFGHGRSGTTPGWNFLAVLTAPEGGDDE